MVKMKQSKSNRNRVVDEHSMHANISKIIVDSMTPFPEIKRNTEESGIVSTENLLFSMG